MAQGPLIFTDNGVRFQLMRGIERQIDHLLSRASEDPLPTSGEVEIMFDDSGSANLNESELMWLTKLYSDAGWDSVKFFRAGEKSFIPEGKILGVFMYVPRRG